MIKLEDYIVDWPDIDYPNFIAWMEHGRKEWAQRIALRYRSGKQREFDEWTYQRLFDNAEAFARVLLSAGLKEDDRVAIWAENRPEWCVAWLGAVRAGCTVVPIDFLCSDEDAAGILVKAEVSALILSERKASLLEHFKKEAPSILISSILNNDFAELVKAAPFKTELPSAENLRPDHTASIIFTSGTTGISKGVTLSHHGIIANINASILSLPIYEHDVFMGVLPLHHTYPTTCAFLSPLTVGASLTICEKVVGKVIIDDTRDSGGTIVIAVPILYDKMKQGLEQGFKAKGTLIHGLIRGMMGLSGFARNYFGCKALGEKLLKGIRSKAGLGSVRLLVAGGGALNPDTADFFDKLGFNMVQGYGMSENGPLITTNTIKHKNNASAGLAVKYTELKIINTEADGIGEIVVKSPSLMKGYYKNPEATAEAFTEDGFLKTGDLGYMDTDGYLFITGRRKNLIVTSGGKNIYPEELESKFASLPFLKELLVLPKKDEKGEEIAAVFVPETDWLRTKFGEDADLEGLAKELFHTEVERVNRQVPPYSRINTWSLRSQEFEKTSSRKIKRYLYKDYLDAVSVQP